MCHLLKFTSPRTSPPPVSTSWEEASTVNFKLDEWPTDAISLWWFFGVRQGAHYDRWAFCSIIWTTGRRSPCVLFFCWLLSLWVWSGMPLWFYFHIPIDSWCCTLFHVLDGHLPNFFRKVLCPYFDWAICFFLLLNCKSFFVYILHQRYDLQ